MKIVGVLPIKGTSERIPSKNIKKLNGVPLFQYALKSMLNVNLFDEIYVDTESETIKKMVKSQCKIFDRDPKLASNSTDGNLLLLNFAKKVEADIYVMVLGTSPFTRPSTIEKSINFLLKNKEYDSVISVKKEKMYIWEDNDNPCYDLNNIPNSKNLKETIIECMSLYTIRRDALLKTKRRIGEKPFLLEVDHLEAVDINNLDDFKFAEIIARGINE